MSAFAHCTHKILDTTWCSFTKSYGILINQMTQLVHWYTVYPKKYARGFCFAVLCCGYTLTDFPISIKLTSLALWQSNDCPSASKATLMNMDKYFMWIHYERLHNHNKAKHNKTVCIFLGIYCIAGHYKERSQTGNMCHDVISRFKKNDIHVKWQQNAILHGIVGARCSEIY